MKNEELVEAINNTLSLSLPIDIYEQDLLQQLEDYINKLVRHDFQKLIFILYRVDVNENRLKQLLNENPKEDAGKIIAALLIERQMQKIASRKKYRRQNEDTDDAEKW